MRKLPEPYFRLSFKNGSAFNVQAKSQIAAIATITEADFNQLGAACVEPLYALSPTLGRALRTNKTIPLIIDYSPATEKRS